MSENRRRTTLKQNAGRRVELERWRERGRERARVLKSFRSPLALQLWSDRRRARRELRALAALASAGLPAPRPLALEREGRTFRVSMEWIPDATELEALLGGRAPWPRAPGRVVAECGRLLAALAAAGVDNPDLHAGNALVDAGGAVWLIDFHQARLGQRADLPLLLRQLVTLEAGERERSAPRLRARFLVAWYRALAPQLRETLPALGALAVEVAEAARWRRRERVLADLDRWTRRSSRGAPRRLAGQELWCRSGLPADLALRIQRALGSCEDRTGSFELELEGEDAQIQGLLVLAGRNARELGARWLRAARLFEHGLGALEPLILRGGAQPRAVFRLPVGARRLCAASPQLNPRRLHALGSLIGGLHDRGLDPGPLEPSQLFAEPGGRLSLGLVEELHEIDPHPGALTARERLACLGGLDLPAGEGAGFPLLGGYLEAFRGSGAERRALEDTLAAASPVR